jgi:elongation factor Ts
MSTLEVNANAVKELRDKTGAGMMQCKKALQETKGEVEAAIDYLRKQGQVTAGKRADRTAKEGKVACLLEGGAAILLELNSETDFVARNDDFNALLGNLVKAAMAMKPKNTETFLNTPSPILGGKNAKETITERIGIIGENISLRRVATLDQAPGTKIFSYIHMGGKIGVLARLKVTPESAFSDPKIQELGKDVCLHICASSPIAIDSKGVSQAKIDKEKEIYRDMAKQEGKPEKILDKIVQGRVEKFFKDNCLLDQLFVKDPEKNVGLHIAETAKAAGAEVVVEVFVRYQLGVEE